MAAILFAIIGLLVGGAIGYGFGAAQRSALRKHVKMQNVGQLSSGWLVVPGSMTRVALLLAVLVGVQVVLPFLFQGPDLSWLVTGGTVVGYGWAIFRTAKTRGTW